MCDFIRSEICYLTIILLGLFAIVVYLVPVEFECTGTLPRNENGLGECVFKVMLAAFTITSNFLQE